jgi:methylenetetrahydrofolate dehydrogenase (NADP+) / methenyltetrahydrofolate cyclohydrolase
MQNFTLLDGKKVANSVKAELLSEMNQFQQKWGRKPSLHVVLVGEDPASKIYVGHKEKMAAELGYQSQVWRVPAEITQKDLELHLQKLIADPLVDGILVQLPLPKSLNTDRIMQMIPFDKDVDGLTATALGALAAGSAPAVSCTPAGVMEILKYYKIDVKGKNAVVVGRSQIVGKPMALLLLNADATVTVCHSRTTDVRSFTQNADIVVVAAGKKHLLSADDFKEGAVVIDVGMHRDEHNKLQGDVNPAGIEKRVAAATPVPGGVGPMTIMMLMKNTLRLAEFRLKNGQ